jgi:hypothetical protein
LELCTEHRETYRYLLYKWGLIVLGVLSIFAFSLFVYRGVVFDEFSAFKIVLLLFIPYGIFSIKGTVSHMAHKYHFSKNAISVWHPFRKKEYVPNSDIEAIDVTFFITKIEVKLLAPSGKVVAVLTKGRRFSQDVGSVRTFAKAAGIRSLK